MPITKSINSRANVKQGSDADLPLNPAQIVTSMYGPVTSTAGQTIINLSFAVDQSNTSNFFLVIDGKILSQGSSNDYIFISIQPNNTSSQIQLNSSIIAGLNIQAWSLASVQQVFSLANLQASINSVSSPALQNYIHNGNMDFFQRFETTFQTYAGGRNYSADRWQVSVNGTPEVSAGSSADVPTFAQSGFQSLNSLQAISITTIPTLGSTDFYAPFIYGMEGLDLQRIYAKQVTTGFWFKADVPGIYSFALQNGPQTLSYVTTFTVNAAATWEFKSITVVLDNTPGLWNFDNSVALYVFIGGLAGTAGGQTSTLNVWQSGELLAASTAVNYAATANASMRLSQVSLIEGPMGFGPADFRRCGKTIEEELAICQRYYEKSYDQGTIPGSAAITAGAAAMNINDTGGNANGNSVSFAVAKRVEPTMALYNYTSGGLSQWQGFQSGGGNAAITVGIIASGESCFMPYAPGSGGTYVWMLGQWAANADF